MKASTVHTRQNNNKDKDLKIMWRVKQQSVKSVYNFEST